MIAYAGCMRLLAGEIDDYKINVRARWPLTELKAPA
jgi:tRNA A37 threonylcarbamoyltransferase TsaD